MPLRWIGTIGIGGLLLILGATPAQAQSSADAFFHDAAQRYVEGNRKAARRAVERGLKAAPSDPRLRALQKKLEQQEKRRGDGRASRQDAQDRQEGETPRGQGAQQKQSGEAEQENRSQENAPPDHGSSRRSKGQSNRTGDNTQEGSAQDRSAARRGSQNLPEDSRPQTSRLSRAQAARLLQALENQEMKLLREVQVRTQKGATVEKDW